MLIAVEPEQTVIRDIRDMRDAGKSYRAIAAELTRRGVPTKQGRGSWKYSAIVGIVGRDRVREA